MADGGDVAYQSQAAPYEGVDEEDLLERFKAWFRTDRDHRHDWEVETIEVYDFVAGRQWSDEDVAYLNEQNRPHATFSRIGPMVKIVCGLEIGNRQEVRYIPREQGDVVVNELLTEAARWIRDESDAEDEESDAFFDLVVTGMGWCLSGDALVRLPKTHLATTRLYTGDIVEIDLENGKKLTGTPNHPVLTDCGWQKLGALNKGDNLVTSAFLERIDGFPIEQFDKVEARLEDKIDAFRAGREVGRFVTAPDDFYSDGAGSKVHVVYADRALLDKIKNVAVVQRLQHLLFRWRGALTPVGISFFGFGLLGDTVISRKCHAAIGVGHLPGAHSSGLNVLAQGVARISQPSTHSLSRKTHFSPNLASGKLFGEIQVNQSAQRYGWFSAAVRHGAQFISRSIKPLRDAGVRHPHAIGNLTDWKPFLEIEARKLLGGRGIPPQFVTRVKRRVIRPVSEFAVHDVSTSVGMFIAGDTITSNCDTALSYDENPDGKLTINRIDPLEMFWDANATKKNLSDARRLWRVRDVPCYDAEEMYPDASRDELNAGWAKDSLSGKQPENQNEAPFYRSDSGRTDQGHEQTTVRMVEVQWWEREVTYRAVDPFTGAQATFSEAQWRKLQERFEVMGIPEPFAVCQKKRCYWRAMLGSKVLEVWRGADQGGFTWKAMTGERDRNKGYWFGIVRCMIDPQRWANKWLSQMMHIMNTGAKGGIMAEATAFDDIRQAEQDWSDPQAIVTLAQGALTGPNGAKVMPRPMTPMPPALGEMMTLALSCIRDGTGINLEILGMVERDQPGIVETARKQAGMTVLAGFFDALRRYRKDQGRLMLWYITNFLADGRLVRIGGADRAKYVPLVHQEGAAEYDVIVDDTPNSPNIKERAWETLIQMMPLLGKMPVPPEVYLELLKYSPLPETVTAKIGQIIEQQKMQPEKMSPEQTVAQSLVPLNEAKAHLAHAQAAKAEADTVLGSHTARAENAETQLQATKLAMSGEETRAKIERLRAAAMLDVAKAEAAEVGSQTEQYLAVLDVLDTLAAWHQAQTAQAQGVRVQ
jgi:intein/homing endonuclease